MHRRMSFRRGVDVLAAIVLLAGIVPASAQTQGMKRRNERRDDRVPGTLACGNSRDQQQPTRRFLGRCSAHSFRRLANPFVIVRPQESNRFIDGINASRNINILGRGEFELWPQQMAARPIYKISPHIPYEY